MVSNSNIFKKHNNNVLFLKAQFLIEIFIEMKDDDSAFADLLALYNSEHRQIPDDFKQSSLEKNVLRWYAKGHFLFYTLNEALRSQDIKIVYKCRLLLRQLHKRLTQLCNEQHASFELLYRGQGLSQPDLEDIKNNIGSLLPILSFWSTSTDRDVGQMFAESNSMAKTDSVAVLFSIQSNTNGSSIFASLADISPYEDEQDILFATGTTFHIDSVQQSSDGIWHIQLTLADEHDWQQHLHRKHKSLSSYPLSSHHSNTLQAQQHVCRLDFFPKISVPFRRRSQYPSMYHIHSQLRHI